jgi:hypothetical protein
LRFFPLGMDLAFARERHNRRSWDTRRKRFVIA